MIIRNVKEEEWDEFMRLLERSYGFPSGFFPRHYPYIYSDACRDLSSFYVIEDNGKLVSHIGLFKMKAISFGVSIIMGGIGGVATLPEERGKGYMSALLNHVINVMKKEGIPLSVLWGDRQRYGAFGWEVAGQKQALYITSRSVSKSGIKPIEVSEVKWDDAVPLMRRHYESIPIRVERRWECYKSYESLDPASLGEPPLRIWVSDDGYVISQGSGAARGVLSRPNIVEVASLSNREAELVSGFMKAASVNEAVVHVNAYDEARLGELLKVTSYYVTLPEGVFRINNVYALLKSFEPLLSSRAQERGLKDYEVTLGLRFNNELDKATVFVRGGSVEVTSSEGSGNYIELSERDGVRLILGGPMGYVAKRLKPLTTLLPIPIHIPLLNYV
ncbi:GNAT family N-acetyltransferase [Caldivirga maquilingensis]|uniref:GCN5-related N-acetyltransferase n=1 Tax=Caldivirga maquilingensis (strain ATCC 700844 / DSM 13496 / JCM 10307 / IC-167) TaxID=397948 RepID=A8M9Q8_CALMQ|nr:GNAT family N-acetyltransferase [Caldivirga maquilingensis]ABW00939.1 GCN5-related N-acetyltransferase [Caldivirga maquilingensis IC-167]